MFSNSKFLATSGQTSQTSQIKPPIVTEARSIGFVPTEGRAYNVNNFSVNILVEIYAGGTWVPFTSGIVAAKGSLLVINGMPTPTRTLLRGKCQSLDGSMVSDWSEPPNGYSYPNSQNIQPPITTANRVMILNGGPLRTVIERFDNQNQAWRHLDVVDTTEPTIITNDSGMQKRARSFSKVSGDSVSTWSETSWIPSSQYSYETNDISPPIITAREIFNLNDFDCLVIVENWRSPNLGPATPDNYWDGEAIPLRANSAASLSNWDGTRRARCIRMGKFNWNVGQSEGGNVYNGEYGTPISGNASVSAWADAEFTGYMPDDPQNLPGATSTLKPPAQGYSYPNPQNITKPIVIDNTVFNPNNFDVLMTTQVVTPDGKTIPHFNYTGTGGFFTVPALGSQLADFGNTVMNLRARCFTTGPGASVSAWSNS